MARHLVLHLQSRQVYDRLYEELKKRWLTSTAAFAEQADVHDPSSTVREALEFSAFLRQPIEVSRQEKLDHVQKVMQILNLESLSDAVIGTPEAGLSVEERKRVTVSLVRFVAFQASW